MSEPSGSEADSFLATLEQELRETPYRPIGSIGAGGMGALYEVEHRTLKRKLVIKILRDPGRRDLEDRLRVEAQTMAQLSHPNLAQVVDYAHSSSGRPFIVSERLYGKTLKDMLGPTGALDVHLAVRYAIESLSGLHAAHRAGVVHRDVKLDNLYLCEGDDLRPPQVKVIDFGIAKLVGATGLGKSVDVAPLQNPTEEGAMIGTPSFMSPEQVTNQKVDHRADIYGMGVVLYRMLAGRNPFICRDMMEYAMAHASEIPTPPSRFAALPPGLDAVIMRALEKDPAARFQSAKEMIEALTPFATKQAAQAAPPGSAVPVTAPPVLGPAAPPPDAAAAQLAAVMRARPAAGPAGTMMMDSSPAPERSPDSLPTNPIAGKSTRASSAGDASPQKGTVRMLETPPGAAAFAAGAGQPMATPGGMRPTERWLETPPGHPGAGPQAPPQGRGTALLPIAQAPPGLALAAASPLDPTHVAPRRAPAPRGSSGANVAAWIIAAIALVAIAFFGLRIAGTL
jgi:serine/threonine-protein kinase